MANNVLPTILETASNEIEEPQEWETTEDRQVLVRYRGAAKSNHTKACGVARRLVAENADREALKTERRILVRDYEAAEQCHNRLLLFTTIDSLDKEALWFVPASGDLTRH